MPRLRFPPGMRRIGKLVEYLEEDVEQNVDRDSEVSFTFGATADVEERVRHRLGVVPRGFQVIDRDRACDVYRDAATSSADKFWIWLKCDTANAAVVLRFF